LVKKMAKKILIVEDDSFLRGLMSQKLTSNGFEILQATDGEEAIKKASTQGLDLILLDLVLPNIDGFEVLSQLKENSATSKIPVIILSNLGQKEDIDKGFKLGAADYLIKAHFTPNEIIEKIKTILK